MCSTVQMRTLFSLGWYEYDMPKLLWHSVLVCFFPLIFLFCFFSSSSSSSSFFQLLTVRIANDNYKHKKTIKKGCNFLTRVFAFHFNGPAIALKISFVWGLPLFPYGLYQMQRLLCVFFYVFFFFSRCYLPLLYNIEQYVSVCICASTWNRMRIS